MKRISEIILSVFLAGLIIPASAQSNVEMADGFRADGKIYVVLAIILIILLGIAGYLLLLDRKVSGIEKRLGAKKD